MGGWWVEGVDRDCFQCAHCTRIKLGSLAFDRASAKAREQQLGMYPNARVLHTDKFWVAIVAYGSSRLLTNSVGESVWTRLTLLAKPCSIGHYAPTGDSEFGHTLFI